MVLHVNSKRCAADVGRMLAADCTFATLRAPDRSLSWDRSGILRTAQCKASYRTGGHGRTV